MGVVVALLVIAAGIVALSLIVRSFGSGEDRSVRSYSEALYTLKEIQEHRIGAMPLANEHAHHEAPDHVHPHVEKLRKIPGHHVDPRPLKPVPLGDHEQDYEQQEAISAPKALSDSPGKLEVPVAKDDPTRILPVFGEYEEPTMVVPSEPREPTALGNHAPGSEESEPAAFLADGHKGRARALELIGKPSFMLGFLAVALAAALVALLVSSGGPASPTRAVARVQSARPTTNSSKVFKDSGNSKGSSKATKQPSAPGSVGSTSGRTGTRSNGGGSRGAAHATLLATVSSSEAAATYEVPASIAPFGTPMHIVVQAVGARCWVDVTAGTGSSAPVLFTGTLPAGASQTVSSSGTVWIRLGAAYNVSVSVNGVPVTLPTPHLSPFDVTLVQS
jgi:hypothetical protein